jgi:hypothetical protein
MKAIMDLMRDLPEHIVWLLASIVFVVGFGYAGDGDYEEAVMAQEVYCENVSNGAWPDYKEADCQ